MAELSPQRSGTRSVAFGNDTYALTADGRAIRFTSQEKAFLVALDQTHNPEEAAASIGKDASWALAFFRKPKIHEWITQVAAEEAARQGMTVRWWFNFAKNGMRGKEEFWEGECSTCHLKQKSFLEPDEAVAPCLACEAPVLMNLVEKPVKLTREQVVIWQEVGSRLVPKIERIQHEFESTSFVFKTQGDAA